MIRTSRNRSVAINQGIGPQISNRVFTLDIRDFTFSVKLDLISYIIDMNLIVFAFCLLKIFHSAGENEPYELSNIAALSNTTVMRTCEVPENNTSYIDWHHETGSTSSPQVLTNNANYLMIKTKNGESLVINSVQLADAGIYYCIILSNMTGQTIEVGSYLIVLASDPTCDVENVSVMENDYLQLQCSVTYGGIWRPVMEWTQIGCHRKEKITNNSILVNVTASQNYTRLTVSLRILAKPYHNNISFVCSTYFSWMDFSKKDFSHRKRLSNNTPDYNYNWTSPTISVLYGPRNVSIYPTSKILYPGDKVTCSGMGNPEPIYNWTANETAYGQVGSKLVILHSMIREQPYFFRCVAVNSVSESFADITFTVRSRFIYIASIAIWLLCSLLVIAIVLVACKCIQGRKERSYALSEAREILNEPNGHIIPNERVASLNNNDYGEYVELPACAVGPRNEARNLIRAENNGAAAENSGGHKVETISKFVGADGTEYVQMNVRTVNDAPTTRPIVHHSTVQGSQYASIDHTRKVPKPRK